MTDAGATKPRTGLPLRPPEPPRDPLEFLARSWSASAADVSRALALPAPAPIAAGAIAEVEEDGDGDGGPPASWTSFRFASAATSKLVLDRIMQEVSPLTSGRLSHSSGPLNGGGGSPSDSPPVSPDVNDTKFCRAASTRKPQPQPQPVPVYHRGGSKTVGRWLKDRRERRKEEARARNAQVHAAVSVAAVAAAVAAVAAASAAGSSGKDDRADAAVASAATLVAAQCVEAAEALGADRDHLAAAVASAVNVRTPGDVVTVTAAAATALRCSTTLRARVLREAWNVAAVIPVEKAGAMGNNGHNHRQQLLQLERRGEVESSSSVSSFSDEVVPFAAEENTFLGNCNLELLERGTQLLKRTRKGALHWKMASAYINRSGMVVLKMKSKHVGGTITKKKKSVVVDVCRDVAAWPGRHLLEGGDRHRYFGLRTAEHRVIEFECAGQAEYELWTNGVARLLSVVDGRKRLVC